MVLKNIEPSKMTQQELATVVSDLYIANRWGFTTVEFELLDRFISVRVDCIDDYRKYIITDSGGINL